MSLSPFQAKGFCMFIDILYADDSFEGCVLGIVDASLESVFHMARYNYLKLLQAW